MVPGTPRRPDKKEGVLSTKGNFWDRGKGSASTKGSARIAKRGRKKRRQGREKFISADRRGFEAEKSVSLWNSRKGVQTCRGRRAVGRPSEVC